MYFNEYFCTNFEFGTVLYIVLQQLPLQPGDKILLNTKFVAYIEFEPVAGRRQWLNIMSVAGQPPDAKLSQADRRNRTSTLQTIHQPLGSKTQLQHKKADLEISS
jgi:hypothetical protein